MYAFYHMKKNVLQRKNFPVFEEVDSALKPLTFWT